MKIKKVCRLNGRQREEIRELESICHIVDKTKAEVCLTAEGMFNSSLPCFYLAYQEDKLAGFLAVNQIDENEVEVSAFVYPEERKKGCFERLYAKARKVLTQEGITQVVFVHEPKSKTALPVLKAFSAVYRNTEYLLAYKRTDETGFRNPDGLLLQSIHLEKELPAELIQIHSELFHMNQELSRERILDMIKLSRQEKGRLYAVKKEEHLIGFCSVVFDSRSCCISDFGISQPEQDKGYGSHFLGLVIHELRQDLHASRHSKKILLHVSSSNEKAYQLYMGFGFEIVEQYDYYVIELPGITKQEES